MYKGAMVALVTPMTLQGAIDWSALSALIERQIAAGTQGLIINGTTAESPTLLPEEVTELITFSVKQVASRVPVIVGTGTNATASTVLKTQQAQALGADAALVVTPYYNKPTQSGLLLHFQAVASAVDLPIILYNVPGRTAVDLLPETVAQLSTIAGIVAIKEAGEWQRIAMLRSCCAPEFVIFSGDDLSALEALTSGAEGVISVTGNVAPHLMRQLCDSALYASSEQAVSCNEHLMPLHRSLFVESNPIPVKWALAEMGKITLGIRAPLTPLSPCFHQQLRDALSQADLL